MSQPSLRTSRYTKKDRRWVPKEPLPLPLSSPVLYHSSTTNSLLLGRVRLGSSTLSCMLIRPFSRISRTGRIPDVTPMGIQLRRGGTLSLVWERQSILRSRQLLVCRHWRCIRLSLLFHKYTGRVSVYENDAETLGPNKREGTQKKSSGCQIAKISK